MAPHDFNKGWRKFVDSQRWRKLAPYGVPPVLLETQSLAPLLPQSAESAADTQARYVDSLCSLELALRSQAQDKANRNAAYDGTECRLLVCNGITALFDDGAFRTIMTAALPMILQSFLVRDAAIMAATTLAALCAHGTGELSLPDAAAIKSMLTAVEQARPASRNSYSHETGGYSHNGGDVANHYRAYFPLALLLVTEPELALPQDESPRELWSYRDKLGLKDWVDAAAPHYTDNAGRNHDPRPFFTPIIAMKLDDAVIAQERLSDWSWMIDEVTEKIPAVADKAAELYTDLASAALRQRQWWVLDEALMEAIKRQGPKLHPGLVFHAAIALYEHGGVEPVSALAEATKVESLQAAVTGAQRCIRLYKNQRFDRYNQAVRRLGHKLG